MIELLVVFAIIAILAALLLPALSPTKEKATAAFCLGNLKQWGQATQLFATDNNDFLPQDGSPNGTSVNNGWYIDLPRMLGIPAYPETPGARMAVSSPAARSGFVRPARAAATATIFFIIV